MRFRPCIDLHEGKVSAAATLLLHCCYCFCRCCCYSAVPAAYVLDLVCAVHLPLIHDPIFETQVVACAGFPTCFSRLNCSWIPPNLIREAPDCT